VPALAAGARAHFVPPPLADDRGLARCAQTASNVSPTVNWLARPLNSRRHSSVALAAPLAWPLLPTRNCVLTCDSLGSYRLIGYPRPRLTTPTPSRYNPPPANPDLSPGGVSC